MNESNDIKNINNKFSFNNKIAIFQNKKQNSEIIFSQKKKLDINNLTKNNENKVNIDKKEEKSNQSNNISNIINQINKKEETTKKRNVALNLNKKIENIESNMEEQSNRNKSFQSNLNTFILNKEIKDKITVKDFKNNNEKKTSKKEVNNNINNEEKNKVNIENKIKENNNLIQKKISKNFKEKINKFNQNPKNEEANSEIKTKNTVLIKSKIKIDNIPNKNDNNLKNENSKQITNSTNENNLLKNSISERANFFNKIDNNQSNINNSRRGTAFFPSNSQINLLKSNENNDNKKSSGSLSKKKNNVKNIIQMNNIQQEKNNMKKLNVEKEENKPNNKKNHISQSILEKLKMFYKQSEKVKQMDNFSLNDNKINNSINNNIIKENKKENNIQNNNNKNEEKKNIVLNSKEKEIPTSQLISMKMEMHINDIRNKNKSDGITSPYIPKKLNLNEIFKNMNIDQLASNLKAGKKEEIMEFAQKKKEEENYININEIEKEQEKIQEIVNENDHENEEIPSNQEKEEIIMQFPDFNSSKNINEKEIIIDNIEKEQDSIYNNFYIEEEKNNKNKEKLSLKKESKHKKLSSVFNKLINLKNSIINNLTHSDKARNSDINEEEKYSISKKDNSTINRESNSTLNQNDIRIDNNNSKKSLIKHNSYFKLHEKKNDKKEITQVSLHSSKKSCNLLSEKKNIDIKCEDILLQGSENNKNIKTNNFCESFFLSSFPIENGKILENSEYESADCLHDLCSILPAMQPEIIYKYPKEDIKGLEINNLAASICFPNGIKICYEEKEEKIKTVKNYRSSFTNQVGERFFVVAYHFFLKISNNDFQNIYNMTPMKYQLTTYQDELCTSFNDELEEDIIKKLEIYSDLIFRENVYIPFCLCLISKFPFFDQMEKSLESILISINDCNTTSEELNQLIAYIVKSIPVPPLKSKVSFALPHINKLCEIKQLYFEDILQYGDNPTIIFKHLSINHIVCLFKLLIFEQKILIVGKDNDIISQIILNFVCLLYPFDWIHTNIPIMSEKMLKFLQSFLPYFNGMNYSLFQKAKPILAKAPRGVFVINIDEDTIDINSNFKSGSKYVKGSVYINKYFYNFPKNIENLLNKELKSIKTDYENTQNHNIENLSINIRIRSLFLQVFVEMLYDYNKYSHVVDDYPVFNSFVMINEKPKNEKDFYKELTSTQLFQVFLQNSLFKEDNKKFYFDNYINKYNELKENGLNSNLIFINLFENFKSQYLSFLQINKNYIIKPFFIKEFAKFEEKYESKNKNVKYIDIVSFISKQYNPNSNNLNNKGILKENKRIVGRKIILSHENDPEKYFLFLIPENNKKEVENNFNDKKNEDKKLDASLDNKKRKSTKITIISGDGNSVNNIRYSIYRRNKEYDLTEEEKDEIKDNIKDIMTKVYKSEIKNIKEDEKAIIDLMKTKFGRDYLVNILISGNKKDHIIKMVQKDSFDFLKYIIFNSLLKILGLDENDENIKYAIKLTKACLFIKTVKNKKEILLSDDLFPSLENYSLFTKKIFWVKWIEDDMTESDNEILKAVKNSSKDSPSVDKDSETQVPSLP